MSVEALTRPFVGTESSTLRRHAPLAAVLALAAVLDGARLAQNGYANAYYAGAVRSMTTSWHNFFFASFDQGGLVSVDKPPLALWVEAAAAKVFGFSGVTILLPEAIAGVLAVWLLYLLVARFFGRAAALVAALALAVSPVSVAVNRDNNPDALFVLLLIAAVWAAARAVESGRLRWLLASAVLTGLAFNTKMLAAGIIVPGIALGYLLCARLSLGKRIGHLLLAGIPLALVSGAWIAAVQLTPAADRPYVGSTSDNSALSLALGYNGLGRVFGQTGGTSFGGGGGGGAFSGSPGFFRLINDALGDQGGWLLPLAIVGAASAFLFAWRSRRAQLGPLVMLAGWFVAGAVVFSYSSGIVHTYYLSALAPATSALVGIGTVSLARDAKRGGLWTALPLSAVLFTAWLEVVVLRRTGYDAWLQDVVVFAAFVAAIGIVALAVGPDWTSSTRRLVAIGALAVGVGAFLAAPAAWSATTLEGAVNGVFPGAGPNFISGLTSSSSGGLGFPGGRFGGGGSAPGGLAFGGGSGSSEIQSALAYVESHGATTRYPLIVTSEEEAAPYVIAGEPVASMGGFTGRETVLTRPFLAQLVRDGEARYFLLGGGGFGGGPGGGSNAAVQTIESTCTSVSAVSGLYDCAGKADAILAAG